jgi:opacity protein-like surface antigen
MKSLPAIVAIILAAVADPAVAQQPRTPLVRADLSATTGWFNASREVRPEQDWYHRTLYGGIEAGWYWTDHLKTQAAFGTHTVGRLHRGRPVPVNGFTSYEASEFRLRDRKLTLTGHYQFGRNAWFHPHVGAGVDLSWGSTTEEIAPVYVYGEPNRPPRLVSDARTEYRTSFAVRPCAEAGFKAYLSPRAFFRTDLRLRAGSRVDEVLLRFGFGVDF